MPTIEDLHIAAVAANQSVIDASVAFMANDASVTSAVVSAAQDAAAVADLEYGNAVNAAARHAETDRLNVEADQIKTARALANQIRVT